ncbi:MAG: hypothetical protein Q8Q23_05965 [bacterium]|nr:hypothetical protein [bacterium]
MTKKIRGKAIFWGIVASLSMAGFYAAIMFLTMGAREVWDNFSFYWYLILGIIIGFGVQIGLWVYLKKISRIKGSGALPGASGAASGTAMLACCAHHVADVLPILGLSGAAIILAQYQKPFLALGLAINLLGIAYMVFLLKKHARC